MSDVETTAWCPGLAGLDPNTILTEGDLAAIFQVSGRTIQRMQRRGEIPPGQRLSGRRTWLAGRVLEWIHRRAQEEEDAAERERKRLRAI